MAPTSTRPAREEQAHLEVGQTAVTPAVARVLVGGFAVLTLAIPFFELSQVVRGDDAARAPWQRLKQIPADAAARSEGRTGAWPRLVVRNRAVLEGLHDFEDALEDEAHIGQLLRPRAQLLLSSALGAGNEQAYLGRERDWLFYRSDVDSVTSRGLLRPDVLERRRRSGDEWTAPPQPDPRPAIIKFHQQLAEQGITLILLPTPVKPTVQPGQLARPFAAIDAAPVNADYHTLIGELRQAGVRVVDPTDYLFGSARAGTSQYLATDTHWRPEAAETIAQMVADEIGTSGVAAGDDGRSSAAAADITARGDIFSMLDLPENQALIGAETVTIRQVQKADGTPWRSSPDAQILVLGDSFSNIYSLASMGWGTGAGFVEHLSLALQQPVDRIVQNDAGAYATRELLHRAGPDRLKGKKVVVWQFATRELVFGDWRVY
jgi:hypothetical protein